MNPAQLSAAFETFEVQSTRLEKQYAALSREVESLRHELSLKNEEIRRSERLAALGQTAAALAHEIRNPLGSITLFVSLLKGELVDRPSCGELLREIDKSIKTLGGVVHNILYFAKDAPLPVTLLNTSAIVQELAGHFNALLTDRGGKVTLELTDNPIAVANEGALRQSIDNILTNAAQVTEYAGSISIVSKVRGDVLEIIIADSGPGIPPSLMERVFEPFVTARPNGTGLGLAVVRQLTSLQRGTVSVENTPGATFTIRLPRREGVMLEEAL